mgnify:FL=1
MAFSKRKVYFSPDVMIDGKDYLRQALGQVQYYLIRDDDNQIAPDTLSRVRKDPNLQRILEN